MEAISKIRKAFCDIPKPLHFVDYRHCCECAEHDETLRSHNRDDISLQELGNPSWDPICFINTNVGFQYYLPALARLAMGKGNQYYLNSFLFHLNSERISALTQHQCQALRVFLEELINIMPEEIEANSNTDELFQRISELRARIE